MQIHWTKESIYMSIGFKPNWNDLVHRHEYHFTDINLAL